MLNMVTLVGRINKIHNITLNTIQLKVPRNHKNPDTNLYDDDLITITLTENIYANLKDYCKENDLVGIKGHIEATPLEIKIIADKVTFLSTNTQNN